LKAALLVVDIQNSFFNINQVCTDSLKSAIEYVNAAIGLFRKKGFPIVIIQHQNDRNNLVPGEATFDVHDSVQVDPTDLRVVKTYGNAFNKTGLAEKLRELSVDTVIITGFCAEQCVLSTYMGAKDLDLNPIILRGSLASDNLEHLKFVEEITENMTLGALETLL
jgi:nicotinamidase-related amidase